MSRPTSPRLPSQSLPVGPPNPRKLSSRTGRKVHIAPSHPGEAISSSDEEYIGLEHVDGSPHGAVPPPHLRQISFSNTSATSSTSHLASIVGSQPRVSRSGTGSSAASSARIPAPDASSASRAPPPAHDRSLNSFGAFREKAQTSRSFIGRPGDGSGAASFSKSYRGPETDEAHRAPPPRDPDDHHFSAPRRAHNLDDSDAEDDPGKSPRPLPTSSRHVSAENNQLVSPHRSPNERPNPPTTNGKPVLLEALPAGKDPQSPEALERTEWHSMLSSVLKGEVLRVESSRIGEDRPTAETAKRQQGLTMWWQMRAKLRGRSEAEERKRVEERRERLVDRVLEEVDRFDVKTSPGPAGANPRRLSAEEVASRGEDERQREPLAENGAEAPETPEEEREKHSEAAALDQVTFVLSKLSAIEALYPHAAALRAEKPLYDSAEFQAKVDALTAWSTVVSGLQAQLHLLQNWTGSDDLDVVKPNTTKEKALAGKARYHPLDAKARAAAQASNDLAADDSTFLERVLKEDSLQKTFQKRVFVDLLLLIKNAKETVVSHLPIFRELNLPDFQYELVRLIGFPGRLIIEALKLRLDAAARLQDPNPMVVNDMIDNSRLIISLAVLIKRQYEEHTAPDPEQRWVIPPCLAADYDSVLLDGLRMFFKLLQWKLRSGSRSTFFGETEVLEEEWEFLYEAAEAIPGGDMVVAEHLCSLTNRMMVRVCKYFDTQLRTPVLESADGTNKQSKLKRLQADPDGSGLDKQYMSMDEMKTFYGKILDAVRMRYRKLQRFARRLTQRFDNSAEYSLEDEDLELFIQQLQETGYFLVYTQLHEEQGTYIMADNSLWEHPESVRQLLHRAFSLTVPAISTGRGNQDGIAEPGLDDIPAEVEGKIEDSEAGEEEEESAGYLLLLSPRQAFTWTGAVMTVTLDYTDFALEDNRVRLVADGPTSRLALCKKLFAESLLDIETNEPLLNLRCVAEAQAHLPRVQKELSKIARSTYRLSESFIESAAQVRRVLKNAEGAQDLTENWYTFASEHGKRFAMHVEPSLQARYTRLLMRLAISWVSFICDSCDPTDRKTFRWTVAALRFAFHVTDGDNILHLESPEFGLLRRSVASLVSLLISHFDILGARSAMEAKREAERIEANRRLQRLQENIDDDFIPRSASPSHIKPQADRSIRMCIEERLRLIDELEQTRLTLTSDQRLTGQVLDKEVSEDRALVFLAASSSNISLRWQQGAFIGGGANGNVYIGFNLDSGGVMAVKEIRVQDLTNSPTLYKQIKDESDVMSMLNHPNIVEYYGIEVHRDRVFIFQEYCEGGSLASQLDHGRIEDEDVITLWALQMLQGLQYLHSRGVEHRDVKPENILLGFNSTIKFIDFGAAKVMAKANRTLARTRAFTRRGQQGSGEGPAVMDSLAGTPMYMAPEVIRASEKAGKLGSADIWSMGCVLLEIATGRKPWSNLDNEWAIMFHIGIAQEHPPLPDPGQLSELGIDFIERCLAIDPSQRPSAEELMGHPWLASMIQQVNEHIQDMSSNGAPSLTSTLVDPADPSAYVAQIAELSKGITGEMTPAEELSSMGSTPAQQDTPSGLTPEYGQTPALEESG